jgi:carbon monoxide dehydrogenase subunit G
MDMTGEVRIPAPRQKVWEALNDPAILKQCIPGCEEIEKLSPTELQAKVTAKVGPVKARFGGKVVLSDLDPPNGYKITGEGSGGAAGFAKGGATVHLTDDGGGTRLAYTVEAHVGGKMAQIGSRLIDATARKMADDFFNKLAAVVGGPTAPMPAETAAAPPAAAPVASSPPPPASSGRLSPLVWVAGLVVIVAVLLFLFTRASGH